ncbi:MAG: hypothetical protein AB3X44_02940 [Leptothrix sp. (in: b-proteobacteria)]
MPHVLRNAHGQICSVHRDAVSGAEWLPADAAELRGFWSGFEPPLTSAEGMRPPEIPGGLAQAFTGLDAGFIRVLEDLVDVLLARHLINITDLPLEAQHKLFERKHFRERFQRQALQLFGSDPPAPGMGAAGAPPILFDSL